MSKMAGMCVSSFIIGFSASYLFGAGYLTVAVLGAGNALLFSYIYERNRNV